MTPERVNVYINGMIHLSILVPVTLMIALVCGMFGWYVGVAIALLPAILLGMFYVLDDPYHGFVLLYIVNYFIMGSMRYVKAIPGGIVIDLLVYSVFLAMMMYSRKYKLPWDRCANLLVVSVGIWFIFCFLELFNPAAISGAWFTSVRGLSFYFLFVIIQTLLLIRNYKMMRNLLNIWAVLTLLAVAKSIWQKYVGFDDAETRWLWVDGGHTTHIIGTGIRYFSFFTDAANFGAAMGMAMVVFSIAAIHERSQKVKYFYNFVAIMGCYGMLMSGTRAAMAVPFAGYAIYVLLSKNFRIITYVSLAMGLTYFFFAFTMIGNGNAMIRRMRSAFNPTSDNSYIVRQTNQARMKIYMADRPFGVGIGLGGGKAKAYAPSAPMSQIATDSWFVMIWVETGVVGVSVHVITLLMMLIGGAYITMGRLKDEELIGYGNGLLAGIFGITVASYANEIFGQLPNGITIYVAFALVYLLPYFEKELEEEEKEEAEKRKRLQDGNEIFV